jgi:hypothetical protein
MELFAILVLTFPSDQTLLVQAISAKMDMVAILALISLSDLII